MIKKIEHFLSESRHKLMAITALSFFVMLLMWVFQKDNTAHVKAEPQIEEFGAVVPKGQSIIPLEMQNAKTMALLIDRQGVIDLFLNNQIIARNLKVIKLNPETEELVSFGALVPDKFAGILQDLFSRKNLRGSLKRHLQSKSEFFIPKRKSALITTYITEENL